VTYPNGTRVYVIHDFLDADEMPQFDWFPLAAEEGTVRASFPNDHGETVYDIEFDADPCTGETWPYLAEEVRELDT